MKKKGKKRKFVQRQRNEKQTKMNVLCMLCVCCVCVCTMYIYGIQNPMHADSKWDLSQTGFGNFFIKINCVKKEKCYGSHCINFNNSLGLMFASFRSHLLFVFFLSFPFHFAVSYELDMNSKQIEANSYDR